jgi:hypothetical protein
LKEDGLTCGSVDFIDVSISCRGIKVPERRYSKNVTPSINSCKPQLKEGKNLAF